MKAKNNSDFTVNTTLRVLKVFFRYIVQEGLWSRSNPMHGIDFIRTQKPIKAILSPEQISKLLTVPNKKTFFGLRNYCMIMLMWDALLRVSEVVKIKHEDVNWEGYLKVHGKGRKERIVPLSNKVLRDLHKYYLYRKNFSGNHLFCDTCGAPLEIRNIQRILKRIGNQVNIHVSPHLLRHSGASYLAMQNFPPFALQMLLGHSSLSTTYLYIHMANEKQLKELHSRCSPADALPIK